MFSLCNIIFFTYGTTTYIIIILKHYIFDVWDIAMTAMQWESDDAIFKSADQPTSRPAVQPTCRQSLISWSAGRPVAAGRLVCWSGFSLIRMLGTPKGLNGNP